MASFTKNKQTGSFDVLGSPSEVIAGEDCTVTKRDGSTTVVRIHRVSKPFTAKYGELEGQEAVIGTVARQQRGSGAKKRCWECGCEFSFSDCKQNGGDWQDSYCGC